VAEYRERIPDGLDGPLDCRARGVLGLGAPPVGLCDGVIAHPVAVGAAIPQQPRRFVLGLGRGAAAGADQVVLIGRRDLRADADPLGLGHPGHHVIKLGVADQYRLVIPGPIRLAQPHQHVGLQPRKLKFIG
jgi:hypothetical protein